jgi:hypothetical protein
LGSLNIYPDIVWTWVKKVNKRPIFAGLALPVSFLSDKKHRRNCEKGLKVSTERRVKLKPINDNDTWLKTWKWRDRLYCVLFLFFFKYIKLIILKNILYRNPKSATPSNWYWSLFKVMARAGTCCISILKFTIFITLITYLVI